MQVKCLRLDTGETIIAHVKNKMFSYLVKQPKILLQEFDPDNERLNVQLGVWLPYADKPEFIIKKRNVVAEFRPRYNLEKNYLNSLAKI